MNQTPMSGATFPSIGVPSGVAPAQQFQQPVQAAAPVFHQAPATGKTTRSNPKVKDKRLNAIYKIRTGQDPFGLVNAEITQQMYKEDRDAYSAYVQWGMAHGVSFELRAQ